MQVTRPFFHLPPFRVFLTCNAYIHALALRAIFYFVFYGNKTAIIMSQLKEVPAKLDQRKHFLIPQPNGNVLIVADKNQIKQSFLAAMNAIQEVYVTLPDSKVVSHTLKSSEKNKLKVALSNVMARNFAFNTTFNYDATMKNFSTEFKRLFDIDLQKDESQQQIMQKFWARFDQQTGSGSNRKVASDENHLEWFMFILKCVTIGLLAYMSYCTISK